MTAEKTDLTFFTNDKNQTLLDRFKATLKDTQLFDVLVGYFRSSGFYQLCDSIEEVDKTRILVGLGIDEQAYAALTGFHDQTFIDFDSHKQVKSCFEEQLIEEIESSEGAEESLETGLRKFIEFLETDCPDKTRDITQGGNGNKLEIRAFPSGNIHAKVYIGRFSPEDRDFGFVITGSSNFSYSGLVANREFNVELRQSQDVRFALEQFENLWSQSVDITSEFVNAVRNKTWLNDTITPYELYLKLIYEYLQEDINMQDEVEIFLPEGFLSLQYQKQAVQQALKKLREYNGVFLADVVGLGKTFVTAQILQQVKARILVICPPILKEYWEESLRDFRVPAKVESLGKLEKIMRSGVDRYDYVVVDEAHRFRNENTHAYATLLDICRGKKVILVTATPLNNSIDDIFAQIKLFQPPRNSSIPGVPNLERFFASLRRRLKKTDRTDPAYAVALRQISAEIRERIFKHVMVRRTRSDVQTYFRGDMENRALFFPSLQDPQRIVYEFRGNIQSTFNQTIALLQGFRYARYIPLLYYAGDKHLSEFERQQQRNIGGFMKGILVKRLESSFYAFRRSVRRFVESYERFIAMFESGTLYISKDVDIFDLLENDDIEALDRLVNEDKASRYASDDFRADFIEDLRKDMQILQTIESLWGTVEEDPKIDAFVNQLRTDKALIDKRMVIFTESRETGEYLTEKLNGVYPCQVMFYSSRGGVAGDPLVTIGAAEARENIKAVFDPNNRERGGDIRILVSTDVLSEGINLHRANVVVNYDLPWNPTKVLQRVGRINRLGSDYQTVFIYNFFPTTQADVHLGLETNITNKIQMFHDTLGEDSRYLSDGEEIGSQELFDILNSKDTYTGEEDGDSELKYLDMIRTLRDEQPELFEKIKRLPKKARSGQKIQQTEPGRLVTFFRRGPLKKFYVNTGKGGEEITFFEAARFLECDPETPRQPVPPDYYKRLEDNKLQFEQDTKVDSEPDGRGRGSSNSDYIEKRLKDRSFRACPRFTDSDDEFVEAVIRMVSQGLLAKKRAQTIKKELEKTLDPLEMIAVLRKNIKILGGLPGQAQSKPLPKREIILSAYQIAERGAAADE